MGQHRIAAALVAVVTVTASCVEPQIDTFQFGSSIPPAQRGPLIPCEMVPVVDVGGGVEVAPKNLVLYLPRTSASQECAESLGAGRPLALLYHANAQGNGPPSYSVLGLHLASHGIVMASLAHDVGVLEAIDYFDEIGVNPSTDVALIGHSIGGLLMIDGRGEVAEGGRDLRAIVLMAPSVLGDAIIDYSLNGADAFLGLHWTWDNDSVTWGAPGQGARRSVFRIYDRAGVDFDAPFEPTLWKHFASLTIFTWPPSAV